MLNVSGKSFVPHQSPFFTAPETTKKISPGLGALIDEFITSFDAIQHSSYSQGKMALDLQIKFIYLTKVFKTENNKDKNNSLFVHILKEDIRNMFNLICEHPSMTYAVKNELQLYWNDDPHIFLGSGIESINHQTSVSLSNPSLPATDPAQSDKLARISPAETNKKRFMEIIEKYDCYRYDWPTPQQFAEMSEMQFMRLENKTLQEIYRNTDLTMNQILESTPKQFHDIVFQFKPFIGRKVPYHGASNDHIMTIDDVLKLTPVQRKIILDPPYCFWSELIQKELKIQQVLKLTLEQAAFMREEEIQSHFKAQLLTKEQVAKQLLTPNSAINHPFILELIRADRLTKLQALQLSPEKCVLFNNPDIQKAIASGKLMTQAIYKKIINDKSAFHNVLVQELIKSSKISPVRALELNENQEKALLLSGNRALKFSAEKLEQIFQENND